VVKNAYCNECERRVVLNASDECANGHPRSALRDVREGDLAGERAQVPVANRADSGAPNLTSEEEAAAKLVGRLVVIVPSVIVIAVALWSGYAMSRGFGMSVFDSWMSSIGSLFLMGACVAAIAWDRRRKMR
jgi:hypothetical protein